jgi:hypothetical protein
MAVLETDGRTQATAALGRVVIDLAEFAGNLEAAETRTFLVSSSKAIHQAVGEPQLQVTIRCRRSRGGAAAAGDEPFDDLASHSTDTTGE